MDFSSAVQWWEEWQLRILVLSSLAIQFYLAWFARGRKYLIGPVYRFSIWLSYLGADAVAIYALATLFNRQRKVKCSSSADVDLADIARRSVEVLWTPLLLMHLGGQVTISAYNIEDNELWTRHVVTAVSQVAVSLYVFCKSWSSYTHAYAKKKFLAAAILMFIPGICKCFDRPLALKRASFKSLASSSHPASRTETTDTEVELEEYIQKARDLVERNPSGYRFVVQRGEHQPYLDEFSRPDNLFVDLANSYRHRLATLNSFWLRNDARAYEELQREISNVFYFFYTKDTSRFSSGFAQHISILLPIAYLFLLPASLSRFKYLIKRADVNVTDVLIFVTYFLEYSIIKTWKLNHNWHNKVAQHNLVGFFARNKRHSWLISIAGCLLCGDFLNQFWCMEPSSSGEDITAIVRRHVKDGWMDYVLDAESYRKFCDVRGQLTLEREGCDQQVLRASLEKPFDETILLWHLATDFCYYQGAGGASSLSRHVSNYMMHLLFANSDMLIPGSRVKLLKTACGELEDILHGENLWLLNQAELVRKITEKVGERQGFVHDAWVLAQELMGLGDNRKMWKVIKGVWVEMLCFSAGRCRGYLHAKSLGSGGEYLSFVWLLMAHGGMETYPERQQRVQLRRPKEERVSIARQRIQQEVERRNEAAAGAPPAEVEVVVS